MAKKSKKTRRAKLQRTCGAMAAHMMLLERFPSYRQNQMRLEDATAKQRDKKIDLRKAKIVTIKTVVNVVYKTAEQNVSTAQINSQIKALNKDFRATNPDKSQTPAPWTRPRHRLTHSVQGREGHAHEDDRGRLHARRCGEEPGDGRHCAIQSQDAPESVGLPAARQSAWLRAIPRRSAEHRRRRHQLPRVRHDRHGAAAVSQGPHGDARDRALSQPAAHLGRYARLQPARTWSPIRRTAPVRTRACRRGRRLRATTVRTATCS